jgi:hypothetical protein
MSRLTRVVLVTVLGSLAMGCGRHEAPGNQQSTPDGPARQSQPPTTETDVMEYKSAEVTFLSGDLENRTKRIEDQMEIRRLLSFFPEAGQGQKGPEPPAPWDNTLVIQFTRADGTVLKVTSNYEFQREGPYHGTYFWSEGRSEGHGEWLLGDTRAFQIYLEKLFEEERKSAKEGQQ